VCEGRAVGRIMDRTVHGIFGRNKEYTSINYGSKMSVFWAGIIFSRTNTSGGVP
jgi:hypothetical protein